ncbi:DUF4230 domain-containing protein [Nodosilinea sp. LEGE 07298]|uniref:DUF4230 domain-containing protein n=1 Tax=Nodosilinea sp. LEGE 07298 TaxID=2777970 RepID=UPI001880F2D7|nr:DUF4230 domain-containing protein [Nodosilinea sp. LEGE 07298]MBE9111468.1 DUF4230 domain-containing protein [Nodosilinea sp. LEGE 07298]
MSLSIKKVFTLAFVGPFAVGAALSAAAAFGQPGDSTFKSTPLNLPHLVSNHFYEVDTRDILLQAIRDRAEAPEVEESFEFDIPASVVSYVSGEKVGDVVASYHATGSASAQVDFNAIEPDNIRIVDGQTVLSLPPAKLVDSYASITDADLDEGTRTQLEGQVGSDLLMKAGFYAEERVVRQACESSLFSEANEGAAEVLQEFVDSVEFSESNCEIN